MKIYLFSKVISKKVEQTIRVGDICFRHENSCLYLWIESGKLKKDRRNNMINAALVAENIEMSCPPMSEANIFSYNGLNRRTGNISFLKTLFSTLKNKKIQNILKNAIDILEYTEDRLDVLAVTHLIDFLKKQQNQQILALQKEESKESAESKEQIESSKPTEKEIPSDSTKTSNTSVYPPQAYYFYDYLEETEQKFWQDQYLNLIPREIFKKIRLHNKINYSSALNNFLRDNPSLNIYSIKEEYTSNSVENTLSEPFNEPISLDDLLAQNGYLQIEENLWQMPTGKFMRIQVTETADASLYTGKPITKDELEEEPCTYNHSGIDVADEEKLKETFMHVATTYKFFWFLAILTIAKNRRTTKILLSELMARMLSLAYPYIEKRISFGKVDKISEIIHNLISCKVIRTSLTFQSNETRIIASFNDCHCRYSLNQLLNNVPFRFLSPWIPFTNNREVTAKSNDINIRTPYSLHPEYILLDENWHKYFREKYNDIFKNTKTEMLKYLEHYNGPLIQNLKK